MEVLIDTPKIILAYSISALLFFIQCQGKKRIVIFKVETKYTFFSSKNLSFIEITNA